MCCKGSTFFRYLQIAKIGRCVYTILITGIIGSGKSLLVRNEIQSIIRKGDNSFLKNLDKK